MKFRILLLGAVVLALSIALLLGCSGGDQAQTQGEQMQSATQTQQTETTAKMDTPKPYPLDYCIVSGEELGSMGDPIVKEYNGHTVKFCCNRCVKTFEKDPAMYIAKIDSAAAGMTPDMQEGGMQEMEGHEGHGHGG